MIEIRSEAHATLRNRRITGSTVQTVVHGGIRAKNTMLKNFDKPRTFHQNIETMPAPLRWGHIHEPWLRALFWSDNQHYDMDHTVFVRPQDGGYGTEADLPEFVIEHTGVSPDALILGEDGYLAGGYEGKCPYVPQEVQLAINGGWRERWLCQIDLSILVTGAQFWWLAIGDPREPEGSKYRKHWVRIDRDADRLDTMSAKICEFIEHWKAGTFYQPPSMRDRLKNLEDLI